MWTFLQPQSWPFPLPILDSFIGANDLKYYSHSQGKPHSSILTSTPGRNSTGAPLLAIWPQLTFLLQRPDEWADCEGLRKTALALVTTRLSLAMPLADQEAWQLGWGDSIQGEGMRKPNNGCRFPAVPPNSVLSAIGLVYWPLAVA